MKQVQNTIERGVEWYLRALRPAVTVGCLLAYVGVWAAGAADATAYRMMLLFSIASLLGVPYILAARRVGARRVVQASVFIDALMIAILIWGTGIPHFLTIGYLWPVALAAYFFSSRVSVSSLLLSAVLASIVAQSSPVELTITARVSEMLGLLAVGTLTVFIGTNLRSYEQVAGIQRACDQATLRLASGLNSATGDPEAPLRNFVAELGQGMKGDRCLLRVFGTPELPEQVVQWTTPGLEPQPTGPLAETTVGPVMSGEPVHMARSDEATDPAQTRELRRLGIESGVGMPIVWQGSTIGLLSLQSRTPRDWTLRELPVLRRIAPVVGTILIQRRILESQRRTLVMLQELGAFRERLIATTSHELRTPLTMVRGFLELLAGTGMDISGDRMQRLHQAASESSDRLLKITESLLELSRMQREVPPLQPEELELGDVVERALLAHAPDAHIEVDIPSDGIQLRADPVRLQQAVDNLVANAARYGAGAVSVRCRAAPGWATIEVEDDGAGVSPDHERQLFTPFSSFSGRPDSTGLGLAVSRAVIEAHGGTVHYRPPTDQMPHAFVLRVPLRQASGRADSRPPDPNSSAAGPASAIATAAPNTTGNP